MAFFFKLFPEIIYAGILYIAEPPLYRVDDKKNPFVINKVDYNNKYVKAVTKDYRFKYIQNNESEYFKPKELMELLSDTASYVSDIMLISRHYKMNNRLLEMIIEEFAMMNFDYSDNEKLFMLSIDSTALIKNLNMQKFIDRVCEEFPEIYYDDNENLIQGAIDGVPQLIEISEQMVKKVLPWIAIVSKWKTYDKIIVKDNKTYTERKLSLLESLNMMMKYQPHIVHRFKGLGENSTDDIRITIMDPNTRSLIKVVIEDIENDISIFQMLRGQTSADLAKRKDMMARYKIPIDLIDT